MSYSIDQKHIFSKY